MLITYTYNIEQDNTEKGGKYLKTDSNGKFSFSRKNIYQSGIDEVSAIGFASKYRVPTEDNEHNSIAIELNPMDGVLKIQIENISGIHDSMYVFAQNECNYFAYTYGGIQKAKIYPLYLPIGGKHIEYFPTCREMFTHIGWQHENILVFEPKDSIMISAADTTSYSITY